MLWSCILFSRLTTVTLTDLTCLAPSRLSLFPFVSLLYRLSPHTIDPQSTQPAFNQFAFFEVQPGHSFHSVEEVVVEGDGKKGGIGARVSLSGWFHKPIEGEPGFEGTEGYAAKSSLQQLVSGSSSLRRSPG